MQLKNDIWASQKRYFVRVGKNHIFGTGFEEREAMSDEDAEVLFDRTWEQKLQTLILDGELITSDDVKRRVGEKSRGYVKQEAEHREFRESGSLWIAQLEEDRNTQLWIVSNRAFDTRSITATFHTQNGRDEFERLAKKHNMESSEYARRILSAHLSIFSLEQ